MCIIIDASLMGHVFARPTPREFQPIFDWIDDDKRDGKIVFGGNNKKELYQMSEARRRIRELSSRGKAIEQNNEVVDKETRDVESSNLCKSNDAHIIALARVSGARVLCAEEPKLHADFKNTDLVPRPQGKIYQNEGHKRVLGHNPLCKAIQSLSKLKDA